MLVAGVAALAALGVWLVLYDFPFLTIIFGITALGTGVRAAPSIRSARLVGVEVLSKDDAVALFRLVEEILADRA